MNAARKMQKDHLKQDVDIFVVFLVGEQLLMQVLIGALVFVNIVTLLFNVLIIKV